MVVEEPAVPEDPDFFEVMVVGGGGESVHFAVRGQGEGRGGEISEDGRFPTQDIDEGGDCGGKGPRFPDLSERGEEPRGG